MEMSGIIVIQRESDGRRHEDWSFSWNWKPVEHVKSHGWLFDISEIHVPASWTGHNNGRNSCRLGIHLTRERWIRGLFAPTIGLESSVTPACAYLQRIRAIRAEVACRIIEIRPTSAVDCERCDGPVSICLGAFFGVGFPDLRRAFSETAESAARSTMIAMSLDSASIGFGIGF
jgi:hypothetical protein